jgi:hypothetical protein
MIHDIGEQDGQAFIAMEFLGRTTLKHVIGDRPLGTNCPQRKLRRLRLDSEVECGTGSLCANSVPDG